MGRQCESLHHATLLCVKNLEMAHGFLEYSCIRWLNMLVNEINFALASRIVLSLNALVLYIVRGSLVYAYV